MNNDTRKNKQPVGYPVPLYNDRILSRTGDTTGLVDELL